LQKVKISALGCYTPPNVLTNQDLEKMVETSDDWITSRTGIKQRRKAAPGEYTSQFAVRAARQAIERAGLQAADIDLILCATVTPDQILPSTGCIIQAELGANKAAAMDVVAACEPACSTPMSAGWFCCARAAPASKLPPSPAMNSRRLIRSPRRRARAMMAERSVRASLLSLD